jgi:hypothetical protein
MNKKILVKKGDIMRKVLIGTLIFIVLLTTFACSKKEETKVEEKKGNENIDKQFSGIRSDYLPFKEVINGLADVSKSLGSITPNESFNVDQNVYKQSLALGVVSADAVLTIRSREEDKLKGYTEKLIEYSKNIGLKDDILKMAAEIQNTLSKKDASKWDELEKLVLDYQNKVENILYKEGMFDQYTLMQMGGWTEGLYRLTSLYMKNYDEKGTMIIEQKGIVNSIINNLQFVKSKNIIASDYYNVASKNYMSIKDVIYGKEKGKGFSKEDLEKINTLSLEILKSL